MTKSRHCEIQQAKTDVKAAAEEKLVMMERDKEPWWGCCSSVAGRATGTAAVKTR